MGRIAAGHHHRAGLDQRGLPTLSIHASWVVTLNGWVVGPGVGTARTMGVPVGLNCALG